MCVVQVHISGLTIPSITVEIHIVLKISFALITGALDNISLKFALLLLRFLSLNDVVVSRTIQYKIFSYKITYTTMKVLNILKIKT